MPANVPIPRPVIKDFVSVMIFIDLSSIHISDVWSYAYSIKVSM